MKDFERDNEDQHLSDRTLMQIVDGETTDPHLFSCCSCADRYERLRSRADRFDTLLHIDAAAGQASRAPSRSFAPPVRWAAGIALLLGAGLVASPGARAALSQFDEWVWASEDSAPIAEMPRTEVQFRPAGDTVAIRFGLRQERGHLAVSIDSGGLATVTAYASGHVAFFVDGGKLLVSNRLDASNDYRLRVPASASHLLLRIGTEPATLLEIGSTAWSNSIDLGRSAAQPGAP